MFTPVRPVKRRLFFTPAAPMKRARTSGSTSLRAFRNSNKHYGRGVSKAGSVSQQVRSLQRFVATLKPEIKYHDTSASGLNVPVTGTVDTITDIAQGDTVNTRTGNAINVVSITVKGSINSVANGAYYRVALVQDKQQIADTSPTAGTIFSDGVASANPVTALPTIANLARFNVLWMSKIFSGTVITGTNQIAYYEFTRKTNIKVSYNGTASTDIEKNGLYVVFLTDDAANAVDFNGLARLGFTDS